MSKSPDAFRTISEVADWLGIQAHVLRFWESKFTQVKPIKRAGGRRYYRPADMALLGGIKTLLHDDGLTIKGVQKLLREEGMSYVAALSPPVDDESDATTEVAQTNPLAVKPVKPAEEKSVVLPFEPPKEATTQTAEQQAQSPTEGDPTPEPDNSEETPTSSEEAADAAQRVSEEPTEQHIESAPAAEETIGAEGEDHAATEVSNETPDLKPDARQAEHNSIAAEPEDAPLTSTTADAHDANLDEAATEATAPAPETDDSAREEEALGDEALQSVPSMPPAQAPEQTAEAFEATEKHDPVQDEPSIAPEPAADPEAAPAQQKTAEPETPSARDIGMPAITPEHEIHVDLSVLTYATRVAAITAQDAEKIAPFLTQLAALRDKMAAQRGGAQAKS